MKKIKNRVLSIFLVMVVLSTTLYGCAKEADNTGISVVELPSEINENQQDEINTAEVVDTITEILQNEYETSEEFIRITGAIEGEEIVYSGDVESFARELLINEYANVYEIFHGELALSDGTLVEGIGYTDYSAYFEIDDEDGGFFPAGFISFEDVVISEEEKEQGIEICNLDYFDEKYGFVYAIDTDEYLKHFVIDDTYVQYGVNCNSAFVCYSEEYVRGECNEEIGALYSFDEDRYVYDPNMGEYIPVTGESLSSKIDFNELQNEIDRILENQDANFIDIDIEHEVYVSKEAVKNCLLAMQEETFLGIDVAELVEIVKSIDTSECVRMSSDGALVMAVDSTLPTEPTTLAKWLIGTACVLNVAGCVVLTVFVPAGTIAWSALSATTIEIFIQVVIDNHNLENVKWSKVGISALTGALLSWACPAGASAITSKVAETGASMALQKLAGYGFLTLSNSAVSAATGAAYAAIDGKSEDEIWNAVLMGAVIGAGLTVASCALEEAAYAFISTLQKSHPNNWFIKLSQKASSFIADHQVHLKNQELENILVPKSVYETARLSDKELSKQAQEYVDDVVDILQEGDTSELKPNSKYIIGSNTVYTDDNGQIIRIGDSLLPDKEYIINGYKYQTDSQGRIVSASGTLKSKTDSGRTSRRTIKDSMDVIGKGDQRSTDHRGHLIGDRFDGGNGLENIVAQDGVLNQGEYEALENQWAQCVENGDIVTVNIQPIYDGASNRPSGFYVSYSINGESFFKYLRNGAII